MVRIHFVPHTHWDREWYLPFQAFRIKLVHLMDRLLDILSTDHKFTNFVLDGQTILLEDYLAIRPGAYERIREYVRSGRLHIGPWYVLPDEFLVSPEALIRNLLCGREVCERFGEPMSVGYIPDPFGHIGQLPQVLNGFGIERAAFRRGLSDEPVELYWRAGAGSKLLVSYLRDGYDNAARAPEEPEAFRNFVHKCTDSLLGHMQSSQVLLLNGTDHHEPQRDIPALISSSTFENEVLLSNFEMYFDAVEDEIRTGSLNLPIIYGELRDPKRHHLLPGVLSSRVWIKQRNHECETLLERWAEPFTAWANIFSDEISDRHLWTGHITTPFVKDPPALLNEAWRLLLTCQPHDSICGCSIDQVHEEMRTRFDMVTQIGNELIHQALGVISRRIDTSSFENQGCRASLVVFNAAPSENTGRVHAKLELSAGLDPLEIVDINGNVIPYRVLKREARSLADLDLDSEGLTSLLAFVNEGEVMGLAIQDAAVIEHPDHILIDVTVAENAPADVELVSQLIPQIEAHIATGISKHYRLIARFASEIEIEFLAEKVPPVGYKTYGLRSSDGPAEDEDIMDAPLIRNELLELELMADGSLILRSLRDRTEYEGLCRLKDEADRGDSYTFCPLDGEHDHDIECWLGEVSTYQDALGSKIIYELEFELPEGLNSNRSERSQTRLLHTARIEARLLRGVPRVDLTIKIANKARDHRLKIAFPTGISTGQATFDTHFAIIDRPTNIPEGDHRWAEQPVPEKPMRRFVSIRRDGHGLMIVNRGLREASVDLDGEICITLLRSFGWLSRDDLSTRDGGAGPAIQTPGGQEIGEHEFQIGVIPIEADFYDAAALADQFQLNMIGVGIPVQTGSQGKSISFINTDQDSFEITSIKQAEERDGIIVRGVNRSNEKKVVHLDFGTPILAAMRTRMDESEIGPLTVKADSGIGLELAAGEIATIRVTPGG